HQPASAPLLAQRMAVETDETVLSNLVMALLACDPASQPAALQLMADPNAGDKPRIAACLGLVEAAQRGDLQQEAGERFAAQLLESLADASCPDELRASCAWALGRMPATPAARAALEAAQNDPYQWVRDYASESLALLASD
ncbi:MAG: hypothetical protein IJJ14_07360, partial [Coriobacteriales bacterium]|nr:hypothetical protein [Coriobacteriales bacterium]